MTDTVRKADIGPQTWYFNTSQGTARLGEGELTLPNAEPRKVTLRGEDRGWIINPATGEGTAPESANSNNEENSVQNPSQDNRRSRLASWCWRAMGKHPILAVLGILGGLAYMAKLLFAVLGGVIVGNIGALSGLFSTGGMMVVMFIAILILFFLFIRERRSRN